MEWLSITEASLLSGKTEKTIRRLAKANEKDIGKVKRDGRKILINKIFITDHFRVENRYTKDTHNETVKHKKEALQIAYNAESFKEISQQISIKDKQIEKLIIRKNFAIILTVAIFIIGGLLLSFTAYFALQKYRKELLVNQDKQMNLLKTSHKKEVQSKLEQIEYIQETTKQERNNQQAELNRLQTENVQQRAELAQKDRLISQLYNDTKEQNKKLLELTKSLTNEATKSERKENTPHEKEAQSQ